MLCGGDSPALLRAAAESGAWLCALSTLNSLLTTHSHSASLAEKRRWVENAALACLWAPNVGAYLGLQRVFPNARLPPINDDAIDDDEHKDLLHVSSSSKKQQQQQLVKKSYISCEQEEPNCDESRFVVHAVVEKKQQQKEIQKNNKMMIFNRLDEALGKQERKMSSNNNQNTFLWTTTTNQHRGRASNLKSIARTRTVASFEKQEIIDLTEKIFLMSNNNRK